MSKKIRKFSNKRRLLPSPELHFWAVERIDAIRKFLKMVEQQFKVSPRVERDRKRHEEIYKKKGTISNDNHSLLLEEFWEDVWCEHEALNLAGQLSIVALYRLVEFGTLKILKWAYTCLENDLKAQKVRFYHWDRLQKLLIRDFNFDLKNVKFFSLIDEIRCLNNVIKHSGKVGKELAQFKGWQEGKDLYIHYPYFPKHFERLAAQIPKYLEAFSREIKTKLENNSESVE